MLKRKNWFLLLILSLILVFAACSSDDETASDPEEEDPPASDDGGEVDESDDGDSTTEIDTTPVTYHYFNAGSPGNDTDTNETRIGAEMEEKTGVNFRIEHLVGDLNQRIGVMVASGDYPDVIAPDDAIDVILDAEAFIPLDDLLEEHGPNLLEAYEDYLDMFRMDDGHIYYLPFGPTVNEFIPNPEIDQGAFWIQRSILKENGYPEIRTLDEYFDIILDYAAENPEIDGMSTVPFTGLTYDWRFFAFSNVPNHLAGYPNDGGVMIDMDTHEATVYADSEYAYDYLKKLNGLNADGHLDQEMFVMNYDEYLAKLSSGRVLGFFDYGWQVENALNALEDAGDPDREFVPLPIVFDGVDTDQYLDPPAFTTNRGVGITVNAENPERIIQYWDEMIKEENQKIVMWGYEGEHYEVDDEGRFYRTEDQIVETSRTEVRDELGMSYFEWYWPRINGTFDDGNAVEPRRQPEVFYAALSDEDQEFLEAYNAETFAELFDEPEDRPWFPAWSANIEQGSPIQIFEEQAEELQKRHYPRIVLADPNEFDDEWEAFVNAYRQLDVDSYEEFFTDVAQSRVAGEW
ncbi:MULTISPECIES: ABC transporter substrate-binding protein [Bacillaceae]|uniref:ABC transporter substrate-binding protein n=1 Tax=Evansella alkalicola TaxID=745819 RepID=A0ABS6JSF4_9BACI|nr:MULTISPECIES: ABC transporter substrate-binding protein [Bacillaceae]MBU9721489.1 ABC transporter substrate-binding protein [Bacillus alkalicola]